MRDKLIMHKLIISRYVLLNLTFHAVNYTVTVDTAQIERKKNILPHSENMFLIFYFSYRKGLCNKAS